MEIFKVARSHKIYSKSIDGNKPDNVFSGCKKVKRKNN